MRAAAVRLRGRGVRARKRRARGALHATLLRALRVHRCEPALLNAHTPVRVSVMSTGVVRVSPAAVCEFQLEVLANTSSAGHKFKVICVRAMWACTPLWLLRVPPRERPACVPRPLCAACVRVQVIAVTTSTAVDAQRRKRTRTLLWSP